MAAEDQQRAADALKQPQPMPDYRERPVRPPVRRP